MLRPTSGGKTIPKKQHSGCAKAIHWKLQNLDSQDTTPDHDQGSELAINVIIFIKEVEMTFNVSVSQSTYVSVQSRARGNVVRAHRSSFLFLFVNPRTGQHSVPSPTGSVDRIPPLRTVSSVSCTIQFKAHLQHFFHSEHGCVSLML